MWKLSKFKLKVSQILGGVAAGLLLVGVACGTAAPTEPTAAAPQATPALVAGATPTPTPQVAAAPPEVEVHPGKVTRMVTIFGNERFHGVYTSPTSEAHQAVHGTLFSTDVEDERRVVIPGIVTKWETSDDGLTWIFTIRGGSSSMMGPS
jgi:ABC-type transport system substrate-binding protein